jgi:iron complex outermembrane recepter protein
MQLGIRWDHEDSNTLSRTFATAATTTTQLSNDAVTKRGALLYKFDNGIAPYIQYTESFQPQTGVAFGGGSFVPTTGQQEEAGIKYQPNAKSLYTLAVFNLLQQNVLTPDPSHSNYSVQTGEIRSRGIELEGKTEIDRNLSLLASYTYDDAVIARSNVPYQAGRQPVGIPLNSAALWADYTFHSGRLDGFGASGGVRYLGDTAGNISGTTVLNVPAVTLFDAAVHYDFSALGRQFNGYFLQVNASNLFDKTYVTLCQDSGCYYGLRRNVIATLRYRW